SITKVEGLETLINLTSLDLSMAKIKGIKEDDINHLVRLEVLHIGGNPFLYDNDIILSWYRNHKDDILNLIEEQKEEKVSFEYPYKVMLLGNHSAGKSSFLKCYDRAYKYKGSTHILQIFKSLKKGHPKVIFYDFGGQDYYHGIYQAFFTNEAINLLFWYDKTDHNKRAKDRDGINILNFNRLYWLSQIGYASQRKTQSYQRSENDTFVIQTHADMDRQKTLGATSMGKEATSLVNEEFFVALDYDKTTVPTLEEKEGYLHAVRYLKSRLKSAVTLKNGEKLYPKSQIDLYNEIQELQKTTGHECVKVSELLKDYTRDLLKAKLYQLYRKGEVLYYRWSEELEDVVWLNPEETVRYIHTILSKENMTEEKGRISEKKMKEAFEKDPKLLNLLSLEKVVFHDKKKKAYIIPGYLPLAEEDEAYSWLTLGFMTPNFTLKFESFIPFGLINQLICYYGGGKNELKRYWRDQLIFTLRNEYMIWIALDLEYLMIKVHINPLPNGRKEKIAQLEQEIFLDLFCFYWDRMPLQERIEIGPSSSAFDSLGFERQAIERENVTKRIRDDIFSERRENPITDLYLSVYDPNLKVEDQLYVHLETLDDPEKTKSKIMGYPLTADGQIDKDRGQTLSTKRYKHLSANPELKSVKQIFISYSKADREDLMELNKFLEDLKREEKIEVYYDETTTPGDMIHEVIRQKIIEADYVIALVSQDYISTGYIRDVELPLIKEKNKRLIPIIIKPCTWTMNEISNHYATLKGTEINFPDWNKNNHPGNYEACRAQNWTRAVTEISQKIFNNKDN
ncbi:TIR domain-containing protein, partial [Porphyromonas cangingivalis]|uniref:TIR domain-containing protein n=1 Tax=Porphyromonas cangingivalis TaxID=36874 RepID=UPI0024308E66